MFASASGSDIGLWFSFPVLSVCGFGAKGMLASGNELGRVQLCFWLLRHIAENG